MRSLSLHYLLQLNNLAKEMPLQKTLLCTQERVSCHMGWAHPNLAVGPCLLVAVALDL